MNTDLFTAPVPARGALTRSRLLEAAVEVFGRKGVEGATVREIARIAGQNVAAIKYYFGGKDQLYEAVLEAIVRELRHRLADLFAEIHLLRQNPNPAPGAAAELLGRFLCAVYLRLISRDEALPLARLIVREQLQPTAHFQVLYEQGFRPLHEGLSFLVSQILGRDPQEREVIVRTHALMGQVYFFAMTREAIMRRLGWQSLAGRNADFVVSILKDQITVLLAGLAQQSPSKS